jgi:hypothetical protein
MMMGNNFWCGKRALSQFIKATLSPKLEDFPSVWKPLPDSNLEFQISDFQKFPDALFRGLHAHP